MWQALTAEEKKEITEGKVVELADQREAQETAPHKLVLGAFHDASKTLRGLVNEVRRRPPLYIGSSDVSRLRRYIVAPAPR